MRRRLSLTLLLWLGLLLPVHSALADGGPIMPLQDVKAGMDCTGETVVQGVTISSFNVHVIDIVQQASGPRILVSVSGPAVDTSGVASGMSGSPVYCQAPDGAVANAGAVSAGVGAYGNKLALVTPIQQMLGEPVLPPSSAPKLKARAHPLLGPLTVGGLSPALLSVLEQAGRRAGRPILAAPPTPSAASFPVQDLVPGASAAVAYSTGTVTSGAIGTVTYRDGATVYAFGHELDGAGRRSLLLEDAYVYDVVNDPNPMDAPSSYKLASPGHPLGTLTSDASAAVIGQVGSAPPMVPVSVTAHDEDTGKVLHEQTQVADETAVGLPLGSSSLDTVAPLALGQAAIDIYNGSPASESGRFCMSISVRESARPLGLCKRYVGIGIPGDSLLPPEVANGVSTDAASALGVLDQVQFAQLHVTKVQATIYARRGLAEASIVGASAPLVARAGRSIPVRLRVRMYRGSVRTVRFKLAIPRGARGPLLVTIKGPAFNPTPFGGGAGAAALVALLSGSLGGSDGNPSPPPPNLAAVRRSIAQIAHYDGLTGSILGYGSKHVYSDPNVLISGHAQLALIAIG